MPQLDLGTPAVPASDSNEDDVLLNDETGADSDAGNDSDASSDNDESDEGKDSSDDEQTDADKDEENEADEDGDKEPPKVIFDRPTVAELKAVYPDIFKKFPALRESYFREIEFTQIFPTVNEAREAVEENEAFSAMSDSALEGDPVPILDSLSKTDKKAFQLFSIQFLPALYKSDQDTYRDVITPVIENLCRNAYRSSDEATRNAAVAMAKFVFGDDGDEIAQSKKSVSRNVDLVKEQEKLKKDREDQNATAFRTAYKSVDTAITSDLESMILKVIDPKTTYSPFIRKQLAKQVAERVSKQLKADKGHMSVMAARWKRAKMHGYTDEDKSKIVSTFLARAKSLVPGTCEKVRSLASGRESESRVNTRNKTKSDHAPYVGKPAASRQATPGKTDLRRMTDLQILEME